MVARPVSCPCSLLPPYDPSTFVTWPEYTAGRQFQNLNLRPNVKEYPIDWNLGQHQLPHCH